MRKNFTLRVAEHCNSSPGRLWSLNPKPTYVCSCVTCSESPCLRSGVGLDDPPEAPSNPNSSVVLFPFALPLGTGGISSHACSHGTGLSRSALFFSIQASTEGREAEEMCWYHTQGLHVGQDIFRRCCSAGGSATASELEKMELGKPLEGRKHGGTCGHQHPLLQQRGSPTIPGCLCHQPMGFSLRPCWRDGTRQPLGMFPAALFRDKRGKECFWVSPQPQVALKGSTTMPRAAALPMVRPGETAASSSWGCPSLSRGRGDAP